MGYELNVRGERLYHSGDTDVIPEMDSVTGVDVALLPVSGVYVMTAQEAAEAARRIQPRVAVPMHWGEHIGTEHDARTFADQGARGGADHGEGSVTHEADRQRAALRRIADDDPELAARLDPDDAAGRGAAIPGRCPTCSTWRGWARTGVDLRRSRRGGRGAATGRRLPARDRPAHARRARHRRARPAAPDAARAAADPRQAPAGAEAARRCRGRADAGGVSSRPAERSTPTSSTARCRT